MSLLSIQGNVLGTGKVTLTPQSTNVDYTITLPNTAGTLLSSTDNYYGLVTTNRPAFRVYGGNTTGDLKINQNSTGILTYNNWTVDFNQGNHLNNVSGYFTVPVSGLYQLNMAVRNAGNVGFSQLIMYKNNSQVLVMVEFAGSSTMNHAGASTVAKLTSGDVLNLKVGAGSITFDGNDHWSVAYLG